MSGSTNLKQTISFLDSKPINELIVSDSDGDRRPNSGTPVLIPDDPLFPFQWHLRNDGTFAVPAGWINRGLDLNVVSVWPDYQGEVFRFVILDDTDGVTSASAGLIGSLNSPEWSLIGTASASLKEFVSPRRRRRLRYRRH